MSADPATASLEAVLERNPASPLFARLAERLLKSGDITRATALCERGLEIFPDYATGHLIHARCLAARSEYRPAIDTIDRVIGRYPGNIILGDIRLDWENLAGVGDAADAGRAPAAAETGAGDGFQDDGAFVLPDPEPPVVGTTAVHADTGTVELPADLPMERSPDVDGESSDTVDSFPADHTVHSATVTDGGPLPTLAREKTLTGFIMENRIVSRTLAEIYARQGALQEAVNTYRLLVAAVPEKREMYQERLRELEDRLRSDPGLHPTEVE